MAIAQTRRAQPAPARGILETGAPPIPGRHVRYLPADDLAQYVEHFWTITWALPPGMRHRVETLPHPSVHIVVGPRQSTLNGVHRGKFSRYLRATAVEAILRTAAPRPDARAGEAGKLVRLIRDDASIRRVEDILHRTGSTKRALQRLFERYIGASPKWVIQRYRLHEAAERLKAGGVSGSRLALELGYADQAHFIRDFKAIVGVSPGAYARRARPST